MALRDNFLTIKPREKAGSRSSARSDYQKHWALCQLLKLHSSGADYLIVFDLHDDVLVFDSEVDPSLISFYQVKTKSPRTWSVTDLLRQKQGEEGPLLSIMGKLYSNRVSFPGNTQKLTFVSNAYLSIKLADGSKSDQRSTLTFKEVADADRVKILAQVEKECGEVPLLEDLMSFEISDLSLEDQEVHVQGKLAQFLQAIQPEKPVRVNLIYKTLKDEVARRNNYTKDLVNFEELPKKKGFGRNGFEALLQQMRVYGDPDKAWQEAAERLNSEAFPLSHIRTLKQKWGQLEAKRLDSDNAALYKLVRRVKKTVDDLSTDETLDTLADLLTKVIQRVKAGGDPAPLFDEDDIRVMALMEWYETGELPTIGTGSEEEEE